MPKTSAKTASTVNKSARANKPSDAAQPTLNQVIQNEISRISEIHGINTVLLEEFAFFVIDNHKKKETKPKPPKKVKALTVAQLKEAVYAHFEAKNTTELKKSGLFKMATDGMSDLDFSSKETWQKLYRKFVGILPEEENEQGYGCINGINIFNYFKPWRVFRLDPQTSTEEDIKQAYRDLSKIYHPDNVQTGDAGIFDRINLMYRSITAKA